MTISRRSFFKRTAGAVVTATFASQVKIDGKMVDTTHTLMRGITPGKDSIMLYKALEFAQNNPDKKALVMYPNYPRLWNAVQTVNYPHAEYPYMRYSKSTTTFLLSNGSSVRLTTAENPDRVRSIELHAAYTRDVPIAARNLVFTRVRKEPLHREWS